MTTSGSLVNDDLFTPTVTARASDLRRPWRVDSLLYPAFFGGPLAATVLGLINGRRLGLETRAIMAVAATGLVAIAGRIAVIGVFGQLTGARVVSALAGIAVWGAILVTQRSAFRGFQLTGGEPAGLLWPGLAAVVGGFLVEAILLVIVLAMVPGATS
jgi:hypothetical protein